MNLLALDLSTERLCLAVVCDDRVWAHEEEGAARASQRLWPAAAELMARAGLAWGDLDGVAAATGPGAFTGLRAACSAAQGLATGLGVPALSVPSLMVVAEAARMALKGGDVPQPRPWRVAMDARMDQVYDASFAWTATGWTMLEEAQVRSPGHCGEAWMQNLAPASPKATVETAVWVGSGVALLPVQVLEAAHEAGVAVLGDPPYRAKALGACARERWVRGLAQDAAMLMPVYVRDRVALTTRERQGLAVVA